MAEVLESEESEEIKDDADLGSLRLNPLGSVEAQLTLRIALNRPIPHEVFTKCSTLSALCKFLVDDLDDADDKIYSGESPVYHTHSSDVALVSLQQCPGGLHVSLYLVHDGSGLVSHYERLLPLNRDMWGLSNPRFFCDEPWETLEEMAQAYGSTIERHARDAALMLGGQFLFCVEICMMLCLTQRVRSRRLVLWGRHRL